MLAAMMLDADEFEAIVQALADKAAIDPAFRIRLAEAAREARRWLAEMEACGVARAVQGPDGMIAIEMLDRRLH
jgi:hypothetical protein